MWPITKSVFFPAKSVRSLFLDLVDAKFVCTGVDSEQFGERISDSRCHYLLT